MEYVTFLESLWEEEMPAIESSKGLNEIDIRYGIVDESNDHRYQFTAATKQVLEKLKILLGDASNEVTPQFNRNADTAVLDYLITGPDTKAVNILRKLIEGTELAKTDASHDFDSAQTSAIIAKLPALGRRPDATD